MRAILGCCFDAMALLPDASIDMVLCDLPYGTTQNKWDSVLPLDRLWAEYWRVAKPNAAIVLTAAQPFASILTCSALRHFRHEWVWHKNKASGALNAKRKPMLAHESVLVFGGNTYRPQKTQGHAPGNRAKQTKQSANYGATSGVEYGGNTDRYPRSVLGFAVVNNDSPDRFHPTQKPVALFEYLIRTYTDEGAVVLDNTAGSGTTAVAAHRCGRDAIVIERDPVYFDKMVARLLKEGVDLDVEAA